MTSGSWQSLEKSLSALAGACAGALLVGDPPTADAVLPGGDAGPAAALATMPASDGPLDVARVAAEKALASVEAALLCALAPGSPTATPAPATQRWLASPLASRGFCGPALAVYARSVTNTPGLRGLLVSTSQQAGPVASGAGFASPAAGAVSPASALPPGLSLNSPGGVAVSASPGSGVRRAGGRSLPKRRLPFSPTPASDVAPPSQILPALPAWYAAVCYEAGVRAWLCGPFMRGDAGAATMQRRLRRTLGARDVAYRVCTMAGGGASPAPAWAPCGAGPRGDFVSDADAMAAAERAVAAAALWHAGAGLLAATSSGGAAVRPATPGAGTGAPLPPAALASAWRAAAHVRVWLASVRNSLANSTPRRAEGGVGDELTSSDVDAEVSRVSVAALCNRVIARAWYLLELAPSDASGLVRMCRPCDPPVPADADAHVMTGDAAPLSALRSLWWRPRCVLHVTRWWRRVARAAVAERAAAGSGSVMSPMGLSDTSAAVVAYVKSSLGDGTGGGSGVGGSSPTALRAAMLLALHRANSRAQGLRLFGRLLSSLRLPSALADAAAPLPQALRRAGGAGGGGVHGHYTSGLGGVGVGVESSVRGAFARARVVLASLLARVVTDVRVAAADSRSSVFAGPASSAIVPGAPLSAPVAPSGRWFAEARTALLLLEALAAPTDASDEACFAAGGGGPDVPASLGALLAILDADVASAVPPADLVSAADVSEPRPGPAAASLAASSPAVTPARAVSDAAWRLLRLLAARGATASGVSSAVVAAHAEVERILSRRSRSAAVASAADDAAVRAALATRVGRNGGEFPVLWPPGSASAAAVPAGSVTAAPVARHQELIGAPVAFLCAVEGLAIPGPAVLGAAAARGAPGGGYGGSGGSGEELSITFWVRLSHGAVGAPRAVVLRGDGDVLAPLVTLGARDNRIEVTLGRATAGIGGVARLVSKSPLALHAWAHVCVVVEAAALRLYVNGVVDCWRAINPGAGSAGSRQLPIFAGRLPPSLSGPGSVLYGDGGLLSGLELGFEGSMCALRYHTRSLPEVHVNIIRDLGPAPLSRAGLCGPDDELFEAAAPSALALMSTAARTRAGGWVVTALRFVALATPRCLPAALAGACAALSASDPRACDDAVSVQVLGESRLGVSTAARDFVPGQRCAGWLLRVVGGCAWRGGAPLAAAIDLGGDAPVRMYAACGSVDAAACGVAAAAVRQLATASVEWRRAVAGAVVAALTSWSRHGRRGRASSDITAVCAAMRGESSGMSVYAAAALGHLALVDALGAIEVLQSRPFTRPFAGARAALASADGAHGTVISCADNAVSLVLDEAVSTDAPGIAAHGAACAAAGYPSGAPDSAAAAAAASITWRGPPAVSAPHADVSLGVDGRPCAALVTCPAVVRALAATLAAAAGATDEAADDGAAGDSARRDSVVEVGDALDAAVARAASLAGHFECAAGLSSAGAARLLTGCVRVIASIADSAPSTMAAALGDAWGTDPPTLAALASAGVFASLVPLARAECASTDVVALEYRTRALAGRLDQLTGDIRCVADAALLLGAPQAALAPCAQSGTAGAAAAAAVGAAAALVSARFRSVGDARGSVGSLDASDDEDGLFEGRGSDDEDRVMYGGYGGGVGRLPAEADAVLARLGPRRAAARSSMSAVVSASGGVHGGGGGGDPRHGCPLCGAGAASADELASHVLGCHDGERAIVTCPVCARAGVAGAVTGDLSTHVRAVHCGPGNGGSVNGNAGGEVDDGGAVARDSARAGGGDAVDELMLMGFPQEWCMLALQQCEHDLVAASEWIVDNYDALSSLSSSRLAALEEFVGPGGPAPPGADAAAAASAAADLHVGDVGELAVSGAPAGAAADVAAVDGVELHVVMLPADDAMAEAHAQLPEALFPDSSSGRAPATGREPEAMAEGSADREAAVASYGGGGGDASGDGDDSAAHGPRSSALDAETDMCTLGLSGLVAAAASAQASLTSVLARRCLLRAGAAWAAAVERASSDVASDAFDAAVLSSGALVPWLDGDDGSYILLGQLAECDASSSDQVCAIVRAAAIGALRSDAVADFAGSATTAAADDVASSALGGECSPAAAALGAAVVESIVAAAGAGVTAAVAAAGGRPLTPGARLPGCVAAAAAALNKSVDRVRGAIVAGCTGPSAASNVREGCLRAAAAAVTSWRCVGCVGNADAGVGGLMSSLPGAPLERMCRRAVESDRAAARVYHSPVTTAAVDALVSMRLADDALVAGGVPPRPGALSVSLVDATSCSLTLSWPPVGGPCVVEYRDVSKDGAPRWMSRDVPSGLHRVALRSLPPASHIAVRVVSGSLSSPVAVFATPPPRPLSWDGAHTGPGVVVTSGAGGVPVATFTGAETWAMALASVGCATGTASWGVRVDRSSTSYIFVGVAARGVQLGSFLGSDEHGWGYIGDNALYHRRSRVRVYGSPFAQGDVIGCHLDMDAGTLSFSRNGAPLGQAFSGIVGEVYPAVAFYNHGQALSLVNLPGVSPLGVSPAHPVPGSPADALMDDTLGAGVLLAAAAGRAPLPAWFGDACWEDFVRWRAGELLRVRTRAGYELSLDASREGTTRWHVAVGDRVVTWRGPGVILGACGDRLWATVDGDAGGWFIAGDVVGAGAVTPVPGSAEAAAVASLAEPAGGTRDAAEPHEVHVPWPYRHDQVVVQSRAAWVRGEGTAVAGAYDGFLERGGRLAALDADGKSPDVLESKSDDPAAPLRERTGAVTRAGFLAALASHYGGGGGGGRGRRLSAVTIETPDSAAVSPAARVARDAELVWTWSDLAERRGVDPWNVRPTTFLADVAREGGDAATAFARGCAVRVLNAHAPAALRFGAGAGSLLAADVAAARGLLFTAAKRVFVASVLAATAIRPRPAEDEYDYPESLPVLTLNRPIAAAARESGDAAVRLRHSLLGQATRALAPLGAAALRTACVALSRVWRSVRVGGKKLVACRYSHPMDDGQTRCFKVKFDSEGVDDYGSLETFACVALVRCSREALSDLLRWWLVFHSCFGGGGRGSAHRCCAQAGRTVRCSRSSRRRRARRPRTCRASDTASVAPPTSSPDPRQPRPRPPAALPRWAVCCRCWRRARTAAGPSARRGRRCCSTPRPSTAQEAPRAPSRQCGATCTASSASSSAPA